MTVDRLFTVDEANKTLPYLRRVVADLVHDYKLWQDTLAQYELAAARRRAMEDGGPDDDVEANTLERKATALAKAIESYLAEITSVGAEVKGLPDGLIDFPGELEGRPVKWCWRLGEAAVEHWHDADAGFAGRQPITGLATARHE